MTTENKTSFAPIFVLWLAGLGAASQFAKISVIFPQLREAYPEAGLSAGFLVSLLSLCGVVLGLFAGIVVAKFGYRFLLLAALAMGALVSAFQALLPSLPAMLASRMIEGVSHLIIVVAAPTLIARLSSDRHRAAALTLWGTFFGVAFALVAWFGLPLVKFHGIGGLFAAHAAAMTFVAILLYLMIPKGEAGDRGLPAFGIAEILQRHIETYRSPFIAAPAMGWLFYTLSFVSVLTLLPRHVGEAERVWAVSLMPLAGIAVSMTIGVALLRHMSAVQVIVLGFAVSAVFAVLVWVSSAAAWACIGLFGALGLVQGASFAAVPQLNRSHTHQAYGNGALAQMGNLGNMSGTPLLLLMTDALGFAGMALFMLACFSCGIAVHLVLQRRRKGMRSQRQDMIGT